jgi:predicted metal-dependent HD superfamily phosphohydrolase
LCKEESLTRWIRLCLKLGVEPQPLVYASLLEKYTQPNRYYHNIQHIGKCLSELDKAKSIARNEMITELCIWFHDVVYDPRRYDNEEQSAKYAAQTLKRISLHEHIDVVKTMIESTKHSGEVKDQDTRVLLDIDLTILGQSQEEYLSYSKAIRKEYNHLSDEEYIRRRKEILTRFLNKDNIYHTELFRAKYEEKARENIRREISNLENISKNW